MSERILSSSLIPFLVALIVIWTIMFRLLAELLGVTLLYGILIIEVLILVRILFYEIQRKEAEV